MPASTHTLPPVRAPRVIPEDCYRAVLREIATGRLRTGRPLPSAEAQQLARKALIEMGDDWTKRGAPAPGEAPETAS